MQRWSSSSTTPRSRGTIERERERERKRERERELLNPCSQGVKTQEKRQVSATVPVEQVPDIMRALGFYPSEQDVGTAHHFTLTHTYYLTVDHMSHICILL